MPANGCLRDSVDDDWDVSMPEWICGPLVDFSPHADTDEGGGPRLLDNGARYTWLAMVMGALSGVIWGSNKVSWETQWWRRRYERR